MASFEDHFSAQASLYAQFRPVYPEELFNYLAGIAPRRLLAWDAGTGNGQAARQLARRFERVIATDASAEQIAQAEPSARVEYRVQRAEEAQLDAGSVDLVTAAQAVHWFDFDVFYATVRGVAAPGSYIAVWMYYFPVIDSEVDQVVRRYYQEVLKDYWSGRLKYLDERYATLPFPFEEIKTPEFEMAASWTLSQMLGFLDSWSAAQRYQRERGEHPLAQIARPMKDAWGEADAIRAIRWPITLRVGRIR